eukprot:jgi/Mesvir1/28068/Mv26200-RA.1
MVTIAEESPSTPLEAAALTQYTCDNLTWVLDSAASSHMSPCRSDFVSLTPHSRAIAGSGGQLHATGQGTIAVELPGHSVRLQGALLVPGLNARLLSVAQLAKAGHKVDFHKETVVLDNKHHKIAMQNNIYVLPAAKTAPAMAAVTVERPVNLLLHWRLGHAGADRIKKLVAIPASNLTTRSPTAPGCPSCPAGFIKRQPFPPGQRRSTVPRAKLHGDLLGPMSVESLGGARYFLGITDDATRWRWGFALKTKDEAVGRFAELLVRDIRPFYAGSVVLRTDNDAVFTGQAWRAVCAEHRVHQEFSAPYCPEQNGVAERLWGLAMGMTLAMLTHAGLGKAYWALALQCAIYIVNRLPCSSNPGDATPHFLLTGHHADLSHMRIFGCPAWHRVEGHRGKLEAKAMPGIFVGYAPDSPAYLILDSATRTLVQRRHVAFNEAWRNDALPSPQLLPALVEGEEASELLLPPVTENSVPGPDTTLALPPSGPVTRAMARRAAASSEDAAVGAASSGGTALGDASGEGGSPLEALSGDASGEGGSPLEEAPAPSPEPKPAESESAPVFAPSPALEASSASTSTPPGHVSTADTPAAESPSSSQLHKLVQALRGKQPAAAMATAALVSDGVAHDPLAQVLPTTPLDRVSPKWARFYPDYMSVRDLFDTFSLHTSSGSTSIPSSFAEAHASPEWRAAMDSELSSIREHAVYSLVSSKSLPRTAKVLPSRWVFAVKSDGRFKARFVVKGFAQREGIDFTEVFSPTVRSSTIRLALAFGVSSGYVLKQLDVRTAFLYAPLSEDVYVRPPAGFEQRDAAGDVLVWKLQRSLYGIKQAPRNWHKTFSAYLLSDGAVQSPTDSCLYVYPTSRTFVFVHVDDIIAGSPSSSWLASWSHRLASKFQITESDDPSFFLGVSLHVDPVSRSLSLHQTVYIEALAARFGLSPSFPVRTPVSVSRVSPQREGGMQLNAPDTQLYQSKTGAVLYVALWTRPDIAFAVNQLAQHMQAPTAAHMEAADRLIRYLYTTRDKGLRYGQEGGLEAWTDADWANCPESRRSVTGNLVLFRGAPVEWCSRKQPIVALSSCEAEYIAASSVTQLVLPLRRLLGDLGAPVEGPTTVLCDNTGAVALAKDPVHPKRTKHIDVRYHFIREQVEGGSICMRHCPGKDNLADIFTKALGRARFITLRDKLLVST